VGGREANSRRLNNFWEVNAADLDVILIKRIQEPGKKKHVLGYISYHSHVVVYNCLAHSDKGKYSD